MKAAVCYEFGKPLVIEEVTMRETRPDEVKVKVGATAICHSDIHDMNGDFPGGAPFVGGHETAGVVDEVGSEVTSLAIGDPVVVSLLESCGCCGPCSSGRQYFCETKTTFDVLGTLTDSKGTQIIQKARVAGFAEYVLVHESQLVKVPSSMSIEAASLLACGVTTGFGAVVKRAKVPPLASVAITGIGGVGINTLQGAVISGANPIIAIDIVESKLARAKAFGATHTVNASAEDTVEAVKRITGGKGVDYSFVALGSSPALMRAFDMLGRGGTAVMVGLAPAADPPFTANPFEFWNEKSVTGTFMGSINLHFDLPALIDLYEAGRYKLDELITERYPLDRINEALTSSAAGEALRNVIIF
jgi:S-(hydroxymethyl)glutathione dehydrogenase / alcohol dehydrogenase